MPSGHCSGQSELPYHNACDDKAVENGPLSKGVNLAIGCTGTRLCPVAAMLSFIAERGSKPGPRSKMVPTSHDNVLWNWCGPPYRKQVSMKVSIAGIVSELVS